MKKNMLGELVRDKTYLSANYNRDEIVSIGVVNGVNLAEHRISIPFWKLEELKGENRKRNAVR